MIGLPCNKNTPEPVLELNLKVLIMSLKLFLPAQRLTESVQL